MGGYIQLRGIIDQRTLEHSADVSCSPFSLPFSLPSHTHSAKTTPQGRAGHWEIWDSSRTAGPVKAFAGQSRPAYIISKIYFNYLNPIWLSGVPQGSVLVSFLSYVIVGKAIAENSRSTSLQRVAMRRVVSLSSGYFLQKLSPQ